MDFKSMDVFLTSSDISEESLTKWLVQLNGNISSLDQNNENIVNLILKLDWTIKSDEVCQSYIELIWNLVTAHSIYLRSVLKMVIRHFIPVPGSKMLEINPFVHQLLQGIIKLIPSATSHLLPMLETSFPYMRKSADIQATLLKNLFHLSLYLPNCRPAILELIVTKLLHIDVHCPRDEIAECEDAHDDNPDPVFFIETENDKEEMDHPLANVLDILVNELFQYLTSSCFFKSSDGSSTEKLDWESTRRVYKELLAIFNAIILPTHACAHIQFIMFYICSLHHLLCEGFVDYLWKKLQSPNVSSVIRQTSVCYMGSLLARAKYVPISMVQDCLKLMCNWIHCYIENETGHSQTYADAVHHATFYATCQVVFYLVTFRHKEMVNHKKGSQLLRELNIERIVNCRLNPLRVCLPVVVKNFASVARNYQIAYCYTIMERNVRLFLPTSYNQACTEVPSFTTLETFFPFDPYLLKMSGKKILPHYRHYEGHEEYIQVEENVQEEQDFLPENMVFGSPQVHALLPDLLHHATSPGFRKHLSQKLNCRN